MRAALVAMIGMTFLLNVHTNSQAEDHPSALSCDGPNHTPIVYDLPGFEGQGVRIFLEERQNLVLSDEETFSERASSVCVQMGYWIQIYDRNGESAIIVGPGEFDLDQFDWDNRVHSAAAYRVGYMTIPDSISRLEESPKPSADFSSYESVSERIGKAFQSNECSEVIETYDYLGALQSSRDPIPEEAATNAGLGRATLGDYVRFVMRDLRRHKSDVCQTPSPNPPGDALTVELQMLDRYFALAQQSSDCVVVNDLANKIADDRTPGAMQRATELVQRLEEEQSECFK